MKLKSFFSAPRTTKGDVVLTVAATVVAALKAIDTIKDYKSENKENTK